MDEDKALEVERRARGRSFRVAAALCGAGLVMVGVGFAFGLSAAGDVATGFGVMAGAGLVLAIGGGLLAWMKRPGDTRWMTERPQTRRDRLQAQRASQLFLFPAVGVLFLALAIEPARTVLAGRGDWADGMRVLLPVLYAWVSAAIALGWDGNSRKNRRYLEDELTTVLRARAMTAAFVVLMIGASVALAIGLVRAEFGVLAGMAAITAGGATAGVRFAWLDREAGRDG